jgi:hypothetical protein
MREWLIAAAAGYALLLITFVVVVAVLDRNHRRADRAVRVLRCSWSLLLRALPVPRSSCTKLGCCDGPGGLNVGINARPAANMRPDGVRTSCRWHLRCDLRQEAFCAACRGRVSCVDLE